VAVQHMEGEEVTGGRVPNGPDTNAMPGVSIFSISNVGGIG
jgi:hypothetical protein